MRTALAEKLLVKIMNWSTEEISIERPLLQALSNLKYDEYQNFSSGSRFIESLVRWLDQFDGVGEKQNAYSFIKEHLIFISSDQLSHLVNITFSEKINPVLIEKAAYKLGINSFLVNDIVNSDEYGETRRSSLFIGLSDGSRIDQLRRVSELNNEQVLQTYSVSVDKIADMLDELQKSGYNNKFNSIFLIDDFTASGTSYFRYDEKNHSWKGKIYKTVNSIFEEKGSLHGLITKSEKIKIHIIFYIATEDAINRLVYNINLWKEESKCDFEFQIEAVQLLTKEIKEQIVSKAELLEFFQNYFDEKIVDVHYKKGAHNQPQLGFNECALPLVLSHNTPNNSLPILWMPEDMRYTGLFPRVSRHKE